MTKEDIIRMAREAGLRSAVLLHIYGNKEAALCDSEIQELTQIKVFANRVAAAEREECVRMCNEADKSTHPADLAAAIRAKGNT